MRFTNTFLQMLQNRQARRGPNHRTVRLADFHNVDELPANAKKQTKLTTAAVSQCEAALLKKFSSKTLDEITTFVTNAIADTSDEYLPSGVPTYDAIISVLHRMCYYHTYADQEILLKGIGHSCLQRLFKVLVPIIGAWGKTNVGTYSLQDRKEAARNF